MAIPLLDLSREIREISAEITTLWDGVLERPQFLNGAHVKRFEQDMAEFLGVPRVLGVGSGTEALILGLTACGIGAGDEVILPANAFVAAVEALWWLKARPVLVDVQDWDLGPNPEHIRRCLTRKTKAVLVVHLYGTPVHLDPILKICQSAGLHLIEDCSHAHGARYHGRRVGSFGTVGCFSTGVVKNLGAFGEAGLVTTRDEAVARRLALLRAHGQEEKNVHLCYGINGRLDELQAAVLRVKLQHLDTRNARRREIAQAYAAAFAPLDVRLPWEDSTRESVFHQYVIRTPRRDELRAHLRERGIETGVHYPTPLHLQPAWREQYRTAVSLPYAERSAREILSLPVFPDLTAEEIAVIIDGVRSFFAQVHSTVARPALSIVVPFYNEEENVRELHREIRAVAETLGKSYEYVFVDDGSVDRTGAILEDLAGADRRVRVVRLARNQGEAAALSAGFQHVHGRIVVTLDGDGQNDPRDIPALLAKIDEGYPVVSGRRHQRQEEYWRRILPSRLANGLIRGVTGMPVHDCGCGLKAYRRELLEGLSLPKGLHRFLPVLLPVPPEAVAEVLVGDRARRSGSSHYGLSRIFAVLRDLLPVRYLHRDPRAATRRLVGGVTLATLLFVGLGWAAHSAPSPGLLFMLTMNLAGVCYLALGYRRVQEFLKAQDWRVEQLPGEHGESER